MPKCDFNKVVYLLHIFRMPFLKNTSGWLHFCTLIFSLDTQENQSLKTIVAILIPVAILIAVAIIAFVFWRRRYNGKKELDEFDKRLGAIYTNKRYSGDAKDQVIVSTKRADNTKMKISAKADTELKVQTTNKQKQIFANPDDKLKMDSKNNQLHVSLTPDDNLKMKAANNQVQGLTKPDDDLKTKVEPSDKALDDSYLRYVFKGESIFNSNFFKKRKDIN